MAADRIVFRYVESSRPWSNGEFTGSRLVYLDTVHASGLVTSHVRGTCDGQAVDQRATHFTPADGARDLERVRAARLADGWSVVDEGNDRDISGERDACDVECWRDEQREK